MSKRIILLSNEMDALGGVSRFISSMASGLDERGYSVEWVAITPALDRAEYPTPVSVSKLTLLDSAPEDYVFSPSERIRFRSELRELTNLQVAKIAQSELLKERIREYISGFDENTILISTQIYGFERFIEAGFSWGLPTEPRVIGQYHDSFTSARDSRNLGRIKESYFDVDMFLSLSESDADSFKSEGMPNTGWMYNPVPAPKNLDLNNKSKTVISLGRYHGQKSLNYAIEAWSLIASEFPDWNFDLYGDGPLRDALQAQIDRLNLNSSVRLCGRTNDVETVLAEASIHVMTSQHEGLPLAIVEAAQYRVPTVAFDCAPGMAVLIEHGETGYLTPQNDVEEFVQALRQVMRSQAHLESLAHASQTHAKQFDSSTVLDEWEKKFEELYS